MPDANVMSATSGLLAIGLRHLERLLIVGGGILAICLGYRMFLAMPSAAKGEGKIQLPGGVSIFVSRVGPGVFFALFGAAILGVAMQQVIKVGWSEELPAASAARAPGPAPAPAGGVANLAPAAGAVRRETSYSGATPGAVGDARAQERAQVKDTAGQLAVLAGLLDGPAGSTLPPERRVDAAAALREARVRLLASVWDERDWGPFTEFRIWLETEADPPPSAIAGGVRAYRGEP